MTLHCEESARIIGVREELFGKGFVSVLVIAKELIKEGPIINGRLVEVTSNLNDIVVQDVSIK